MKPVGDASVFDRAIVVFMTGMLVFLQLVLKIVHSSFDIHLDIGHRRTKRDKQETLQEIG